MPFALKDPGVAMKGTVTTQGSVFFKDAVADYDSTLVQTLPRGGLEHFCQDGGRPSSGKRPPPNRACLAARSTLEPETEQRRLFRGGSYQAAVAAGILPVAQ